MSAIFFFISLPLLPLDMYVDSEAGKEDKEDEIWEKNH